MSKKPIERLNYFNGQRLEATDLRLEQEYHISVRRWLNKSLYSPGIAKGLTVRKGVQKDQGVATTVVLVGAGLAIDSQGREIILVEDRAVPFQNGVITPTGEKVAYLAIEYNEQKTEVESGSCKVPSSRVGEAPDRAAWGGPGRMAEEPVVKFFSELPPEAGDKILLAKVTQNNNCADLEFDVSLRRYIGAASASKVNQYALEGERHIDKNNPGRIYFHIRGRQPNAVTLYLRSDSFSTLHYTELGHHDHDISVSVGSLNIPGHTHSATASSGTAGSHTPSVKTVRAMSSNVIVGDVSHGFNIDFRADLKDQDIKAWTKMRITLNSVSGHTHPITVTVNPDSAKTIPLSGTGSSIAAGVTDQSARSVKDGKGHETAKALTYVNDLQVRIRKIGNNYVDCTTHIQDQLKTHRSSENWNQLGFGGQSGDSLIDPGTGPIKLDFLPNISFDPSNGGEYEIELSVKNGSGGRILYNLYVE